MTSGTNDAERAPRVLVAHASRHGSTAEIADRIAERLAAAGLDAVAMDVDDVADDTVFDAYVVGGAAYMFHWLKPATAFVRRNEELLARRPVWLFSSGPVGDETVDEDGNDVLEVTRPREFDELHDLLEPRDEKVFFGKWDPDAPAIGFAERMMKFVPAGRAALPAGDFRDWDDIDAWADTIAAALRDAEVLPPGGPTPDRGDG
jgi:menaquinone-dependent protoporphyrinogen oxidase